MPAAGATVSGPDPACARLVGISRTVYWPATSPEVNRTALRMHGPPGTGFTGMSAVSSTDPATELRQFAWNWSTISPSTVVIGPPSADRNWVGIGCSESDGHRTTMPTATATAVTASVPMTNHRAIGDNVWLMSDSECA